MSVWTKPPGKIYCSSSFVSDFNFLVWFVGPSKNWYELSPGFVAEEAGNHPETWQLVRFAWDCQATRQSLSNPKISLRAKHALNVMLEFQKQLNFSMTNVTSFICKVRTHLVYTIVQLDSVIKPLPSHLLLQTLWANLMWRESSAQSFRSLSWRETASLFLPSFSLNYCLLLILFFFSKKFFC